MKSLSVALAVLVSLALGPARALAAKPFTPDPAYDATYERSDMDGDGEVSKAEAAGNEPLVVGFFRADRNRDGKLTRKEYEALFRAKEKAEARAKARAEAKARAQVRAQAKAQARTQTQARGASVGPSR